MTVSQTLATAVSGIKANARKANVTANNIVNQNTPGFEAQTVRTVAVVTGGLPSLGGGVRAEVVGDGVVDVATEFTRLIEAGVAYRASIKVVQTIEEMERQAVDIIA